MTTWEERMTESNAKAQRERDTLHGMGKAVADELGGEWSAEYDHAGEITMPDGMVVWVGWQDWQRKRIEFSEHYPQESYQLVYNQPNFRTTVDPTRSAAVVARQVQRKVMTEDYREALKRAHDAIATRDKRAREVAELTAELTEAFGLTFRDDRGWTGYRDNGSYGDVHVFDGERVDLDVKNLTPDQARRVLAIVTETA